MAGSARASVPSTTRPRVASRSTPTRSGSTASGAGLAVTFWTSCSGPRTSACRMRSGILTPALDLLPGVVPCSTPTRLPRTESFPPRDPALLTAAVRFYAGCLRRSPEGREYLASRRVGPEAAARLGLGFSPGQELRQALESAGFSERRIRDSGLFTDRGAERFAGMVVVPDASGSLVRWLAGRAIDPGTRPRFQAPPGPKPVLGLGRLGPTPPWTGLDRGSLRLACPCPVEASPPALPWVPRALSASPRSSGAAPGSS